MGIDGIGKGGARPPAPDPQGAGAVDKKSSVETPFSTAIGETARLGNEVEKPDRTGDATAASSPLARFRAGEVDVNGYIDLKVDEVVGNVKGLSPAEIDDIRAMLREQIVTDPGLSDLVQVATGQAPRPPED